MKRYESYLPSDITWIGEIPRAIMEYINAKTQSIDAMIANLQGDIDILTEYKQRLIADVVTGQIKVD